MNIPAKALIRSDGAILFFDAAQPPGEGHVVDVVAMPRPDLAPAQAADEDWQVQRDQAGVPALVVRVWTVRAASTLEQVAAIDARLQETDTQAQARWIEDVMLGNPPSAAALDWSAEREALRARRARLTGA